MKKNISNLTNIKKSEKGFIWSYVLSGGGGFMMMQATIASYFSIFMTDKVGIPLKSLSMIIFIGSLLDAISNPLIGVITDKTKSKWGRYRPYFIVPPILLSCVAYFLFLAPKNLNVNQKIVYCSLFYVFFQLLITLCYLPQMAILPAYIKSSKERNKIVVFVAIAVSIAFTIASSFYNQLSELFGGTSNLMLVYGVFTIIPFWCLFKYSKEKYLVSFANRPFLDDLKLILKRRELYRVLLVWVMASLGYGVMFSASTYYVLYYLEMPNLISPYMLILSLGANLSMIVAMPICLKLFKTAQKTLIITQFIAIICYSLLFFLGKNINLLFILSFIAALFASMQMGLINILLNDMIDYIMLKDHISLNGTMVSIKSFSFKLGGAVGNTIILQVLALTGYISGQIGRQPVETIIGINCMRFVVPIIGGIIIILSLWEYPIEKYYPKIEEMKARFGL